MTRKGQRRAGLAVPDVTVNPRAIPKPPKRRDKVFQMRLTTAEFNELHEMAEKLGLTITSYLLGLHKQAVAALSRKGGK